MNSCPLTSVVGTGRRPSREMSVSGDGGAVPCACGTTSTSTTAMMQSAAVRKRLSFYLGGRRRVAVGRKPAADCPCPLTEYLADACDRQNQEHDEQQQEQAGEELRDGERCARDRRKAQET